MALDQISSAPKRRSRIAMAAVLLLFATALACQWKGVQSVAVADSIGYITGGVNLIHLGEYRNPFGQPEFWFPPLYPLLIGTLSLGGQLDPLLVARLISVAFAILCLLLVFAVGRVAEPGQPYVGVVAAIVLAANPTFQAASHAALSESMATALMFAAFVVWLRLSAEAGAARYVIVGVLLGLSYLTRPETIVLLPLWAAIDLWPRPGKPKLSKYVLTFACCLAVISPYVLWLSSHTGRLSLTNKGEVNLAAGRSEYYRIPREYIDPQTLEMGFFAQEHTPTDEVQRYLHNWVEIARSYWEMYRGPLGGGVLAAILLGVVTLVRERRYRLLFGLSTHFVYLFALAQYAVDTRYLHATLPALSVLAAFGLVAAIRLLVTKHAFIYRGVGAIVVVWAAVGLTEMASRYPRWAVSSPSPPVSLLRDCGQRLKAADPSEGVVYEQGATVGYYAGKRRGRLTPNDLDTLLLYLEKHEEPHTPVWLALSSLNAAEYHPSVRALLDADGGKLPVQLDMRDERGRVVVYRIR
jgi:hypothetical protein